MANWIRASYGPFANLSHQEMENIWDYPAHGTRWWITQDAVCVCVCDLAGGLENVNPLPPPQGSVSPGKTPNSRPSDVIRTLQPTAFPGSEGSTQPFLLTAGTTQSSETKLEFHPFPHSPAAETQLSLSLQPQALWTSSHLWSLTTPNSVGRKLDFHGLSRLSALITAATEDGLLTVWLPETFGTSWVGNMIYNQITGPFKNLIKCTYLLYPSTAVHKNSVFKFMEFTDLT